MSNGMWCMRTLIVLHWFSPQLIPERHSLHCSHHSKLLFLYIVNAKQLDEIPDIIGV